MKKAKRQFRNFKDYHLEKLQDPEDAKLYLTIALEEFEKDGDTDAFLLSLKDVAMAQGGMLQLSRRTRLDRTNLYKALSKEGNPRLDTISAILLSLGLRLSVETVR